MGEGALQVPNFINWDFGLFENIPLPDEHLRLRFQAEFFHFTIA